MIEEQEIQQEIPSDEMALSEARFQNIASVDDFKDSMSHLPVLRQLGVALGLLVVVFGVTYIGTISALVKPPISSEANVLIETTLDAPTEVLQDYTNPFDNTTLVAKAAFVWDIQSQKVLFNKNADDELPLASITKLMTALVTHELLDESATVDISLNAMKADGDSGFIDGEQFSLRDLLDLTLIASSNDGAVALGAAAAASVDTSREPNQLFVDAMNLRAKELGLEKTHFNNPTGLDVSESLAGGYSTAREVVFLLEYIITTYPELTAQTTVASTKINNANGEYHLIENTNDVIGSIEGLIASKTGYTNLAGGNLVVAFEAGLNRPIIVAVLGSTQNERFSDVLELVKRSRTFIAKDSE